MSKLDKVKYVLEQAGQPVSIDYLVKMTRFDEDLVRFMVDELKSVGKVKIEQTGDVSWTSKSMLVQRPMRR